MSYLTCTQNGSISSFSTQQEEGYPDRLNACNNNIYRPSCSEVATSERSTLMPCPLSYSTTVDPCYPTPSDWTIAYTNCQIKNFMNNPIMAGIPLSTVQCIFGSIQNKYSPSMYVNLINSNDPDFLYTLRDITYNCTNNLGYSDTGVKFCKLNADCRDDNQICKNGTCQDNVELCKLNSDCQDINQICKKGTCQDNNKKLTTWEMIGIVIGGVVLLMIILMFIKYLMKH